MKSLPARCRLSLFLPLFVLIAVGCGEESDLEIRSYQTAKTDAVFDANHVDRVDSDTLSDPHAGVAPRVAAKKTHRMIAAIVPHGGSMFYFKTIIPIDNAKRVAKTTQRIAELLNTLKFPGGKPKWQVPEGWRQLPDDSPRNAGGGFRRIATIQLDPKNDESLELSVTSLKAPADPKALPQYYLINVNRWRGQLRLPRVTLKNLYTDPKDTDAEQEVRKHVFHKGKPDELSVVLVNLLGQQ